MAYEVKEWRPVPEFAFLEASSEGELRTLDRHVPQVVHGSTTLRFCPGTLLKQHINPRGRYIVSVLGKSVSVSRLICPAFHGPSSEGKPWVLHEDDNPLNNRAGNLRWGSPSENTLDCIAKRRGFIGLLNGNAKLDYDEVMLIRNNYKLGVLSQNELAHEFNVSQSLIHLIVSGKSRLLA